MTQAAESSVVFSVNELLHLEDARQQKQRATQLEREASERAYQARQIEQQRQEERERLARDEAQRAEERRRRAEEEARLRGIAAAAMAAEQQRESAAAAHALALQEQRLQLEYVSEQHKLQLRSLRRALVTGATVAALSSIALVTLWSRQASEAAHALEQQRSAHTRQLTQLQEALRHSQTELQDTQAQVSALGLRGKAQAAGTVAEQPSIAGKGAAAPSGVRRSSDNAQRTPQVIVPKHSCGQGDPLCTDF